LKEQVAALENKIGDSHAELNSHMAVLREDLDKRETALNKEIDELR
jgi:hypothetical protein